MGLFDNLFGGKKTDQDTDTTNNTAGQVNAPQTPGADAQPGSTGAVSTGVPSEPTAAPAPNTSVEINDDGEFSAQPDPVLTQAPAEPAVTVPSAAPEATIPAEESPATEQLPAAPASDEDKTV